MSIGRDVYCDSRLILQKLEEKFPRGSLGASQPDQKAIEKLLGKWTVDGGVFTRAAQLIPPDMPLLKDPKFTKDREEYTGRSWARSDVTKMRPEALAQMRDNFEFLETGLLADGREWVLKTAKPSLADIEGESIPISSKNHQLNQRCDSAIWLFHWLIELKGALPPSLISEKQFPKVFAYIDRFSKALSAAKLSAPKPVTLKGADAVKFVTQADFAEPEGQVDDSDPLALKKGQDVEVWPIDTGFKHRDRGRLVALTLKESVVATQSKVGGKEIRVHHPRTNFRIQAVSEAGSKL